MANDRITQIPVRVLVLPPNPKARVTQIAVRVLVGPANNRQIPGEPGGAVW